LRKVERNFTSFGFLGLVQDFGPAIKQFCRSLQSEDNSLQLSNRGPGPPLQRERLGWQRMPDSSQWPGVQNYAAGRGWPVRPGRSQNCGWLMHPYVVFKTDECPLNGEHNSCIGSPRKNLSHRFRRWRLLSWTTLRQPRLISAISESDWRERFKISSSPRARPTRSYFSGACE
jgi:hypothetical protein